jgi:hypothetical protein
MILTVNYNKTSGAITLASDESEVAVELNQDSVLDLDGSLNFEAALNLSAYQESFNEDIEDGHDN